MITNTDKKKLLVFDVGAAIGTITQEFIIASTRNQISIEVHCFEPLLEYFEKLIQNVVSADNNIVVCNSVALSDRIGEAFFHQNNLPYTSSLLPSIENAGRSWGNLEIVTERTVRVQTDTIDNYSLKNNLADIDILKIDVQGGEISVLRGAVNMLKEKRINQIYLEVLIENTYTGQSTLEEIILFLSEHQYRLTNIFNIEKSNGKLLQIDICFSSACAT